jgi:hypothetical protein
VNERAENDLVADQLAVPWVEVAASHPMAVRN